jgi:hypothetical protein
MVIQETNPQWTWSANDRRTISKASHTMNSPYCFDVKRYNSVSRYIQPNPTVTRPAMPYWHIWIKISDIA